MVARTMKGFGKAEYTQASYASSVLVVTLRLLRSETKQVSEQVV